MPNYGDPKYWDKRYTEQDGVIYDWLEKYEALKPIFKDVANKDTKILVIGCGNSELSENMYDDGLTNITNIDISSIAIEQMTKRSMARPHMVYKAMDACKMDAFADGAFNLVVDKSTMDSLLCSEKSYISVAYMMKVCS